MFGGKRNRREQNSFRTRWRVSDHKAALEGLARQCQKCSDTGYTVGWVTLQDPPITKIKFTPCDCGVETKHEVELYVHEHQGVRV